MKFLRQHLPVRYEITSLHRREIPALPEAALREAVPNAVIHRDYFERGGVVMVELYQDRLQIINPGGLPPGLRLEDLGRLRPPAEPAPGRPLPAARLRGTRRQRHRSRSRRQDGVVDSVKAEGWADFPGGECRAVLQHAPVLPRNKLAGK
jgi:hypothetical protein